MASMIKKMNIMMMEMIIMILKDIITTTYIVCQHSNDDYEHKCHHYIANIMIMVMIMMILEDIITIHIIPHPQPEYFLFPTWQL